MDEPKKNESARTPLSDLAEAMAKCSSKKVSLKEAPLCGQITIRTKPDNTDAFQAFKSVTELDLPQMANTYSTNDSFGAYWMGPSEWLLTNAEEDATNVLEKLELETRDMHVSIVDVSDNRTRLILAGNMASIVLNKTCAMDLHPRILKPGQCVQTLVGRTQVLLAMTTDNPVEFHLFVRNSFAVYLAEFLLDAMREFAQTSTAP